MSPEELEKKEQADKVDAEKEAKALALSEECKKTSEFSKLMQYNHLKILIPLGIVGAMVNGSVNPICGIAFAKILSLLSILLVRPLLLQ